MPKEIAHIVDGDTYSEFMVVSIGDLFLCDYEISAIGVNDKYLNLLWHKLMIFSLFF